MMQAHTVRIRIVQVHSLKKGLCGKSIGVRFLANPAQKCESVLSNDNSGNVYCLYNSVDSCRVRLYILHNMESSRTDGVF